jgi:uncharacterized protein YeaO (DUF488 family)
MLRAHRVYDLKEVPPGERFLVDRLWPRGVRKEDLHLAGWLKDAAPSDALRRWFAHDPGKWMEFRKRYFAELAARPEVWEPLKHALATRDVVLLFAAKDAAHNNAVALREFLETHLAKSRRPHSHAAGA